MLKQAIRAFVVYVSSETASMLVVMIKLSYDLSFKLTEPVKLINI